MEVRRRGDLSTAGRGSEIRGIGMVKSSLLEIVDVVDEDVVDRGLAGGAGGGEFLGVLFGGLSSQMISPIPGISRLAALASSLRMPFHEQNLSGFRLVSDVMMKKRRWS